MMLKGGICMIILLLVPLFMTGFGLAKAIWGCTDPRIQVCMGLIRG